MTLSHSPDSDLEQRAEVARNEDRAQRAADIAETNLETMAGAAEVVSEVPDAVLSVGEAGSAVAEMGVEVASTAVEGTKAVATLVEGVATAITWKMKLLGYAAKGINHIGAIGVAGLICAASAFGLYSYCSRKATEGQLYVNETRASIDAKIEGVKQPIASTTSTVTGAPAAASSWLRNTAYNAWVGSVREALPDDEGTIFFLRDGQLRYTLPQRATDEEIRTYRVGDLEGITQIARAGDNGLYLVMRALAQPEREADEAVDRSLHVYHLDVADGKMSQAYHVPTNSRDLGDVQAIHYDAENNRLFVQGTQPFQSFLSTKDHQGNVVEHGTGGVVSSINGRDIKRHGAMKFPDRTDMVCPDGYHRAFVKDGILGVSNSDGSDPLEIKVAAEMPVWLPYQMKGE